MNPDCLFEEKKILIFFIQPFKYQVFSILIENFYIGAKKCCFLFPISIPEKINEIYGSILFIVFFASDSLYKCQFFYSYSYNYMMDRFEDSVTIQDNSDSLLSNKGTNHIIKPQEEESDNYEESFLNMCREIAQKNQNEKKDENIEKQMDELERECNSSRRSISQAQEPNLAPKNCFDPLYEKVVKNRQELLQENERGDKMFKPNPEWNNYQEIQQRKEQNLPNLIQKEDANKKQQEQIEQKGQNEQQKQKEQKNEIQQRGQKNLQSLELTEEQKLEQKFRDSLKNHYEKQKGIRKVRRTIVDQVFYEDPETKQLDKKTKRVIIEQDSKKKHLRKCVKKIQQMLRKIISLYE